MKKLPFILLLVAWGCAPLPSVEIAGPPEPLVLATFTGEVDRVAGTFTVQSEPTALGRALGMSALLIPSGSPGVTVANSAGTLWNGEAGHCPGYPAALSTGAVVNVTSNYSSPTVLLHVYAEITQSTPSIASACNSETGTVIPGVTAGNGGLWYYGTVTAGQTKQAAWAFSTGSGTRFTFNGRIVAFRLDSWTNMIPATYQSQSPQQYMAGSTTSAVFLDTTTMRRVTIVDSSGSYVTSASVSADISAIATNADGSRIWLTLGLANKLALLNPDGSLFGEYPLVGALGPGGHPGYLTVDPIDGIVWFTITAGKGIGWYDPRGPSQGFVDLNQEVGQPVMAVNSGGVCLLYVGRSGWPLARLNCTTKSGVVNITGVPGCGGASTMAVGAGGDVWFLGSVQRICKVSPGSTTATSEVTTSSTYTGLTYADGHLWTMDGVGLTRIWLGTPIYAQTSLDLPATSWGLVAGAGAVWAPRSSNLTTSHLNRLVP
jgi:streptogramin lyase